MQFTNYNGQLLPAADAMVPAGNTAFRYGNGLFETMLVRDGAIRLAAYHWERLWGGMEQLHFAAPLHFTPEVLQEQILRTVRKNGLLHLCRVRLQVFGSNGSIWGPDDNQLHYLIECYPLSDADMRLNENGLVCGIATGVSKNADSVSHLKTSNALVYAMAARQAKQNKWNDALVLNIYGRIVESAIANVFWVRDGMIYTPPVTEGCIEGVMRRHILTSLPDITEQPLTEAELMGADEVFLTNAIKGLRWIRTIEDASYNSNWAEKLHQKLLLH